MSVVVVATIHPVPELFQEVTELYEAIIPRVHAEDSGCLLYALHEDGTDLVMIEKWASEEDLTSHSTSPVMTELRPRLAGKLAAPAEVKLYRARPAGTDTQGAL